MNFSCSIIEWSNPVLSLSFDPRTRPWYQVAETTSLTWTDLIPQAYTGEILVAGVERFYEGSNLLYVTAVQITVPSFRAIFRNLTT